MILKNKICILFLHCSNDDVTIKNYETIKKYKPVMCLELYEQWLNRYGNTTAEVLAFMKELGYLITDTYVTDVILVHKDNL